MPVANPPPPPPLSPAADRPSWLPQDAVIPGTLTAPPAASPSEAAYVPVGIAAPAWSAPAQARTSRTWAIVAIGVGLLLIVGGGGAYAYKQITSQSSTIGATTTAGGATPPGAASPIPSPVALTGTMAGEYLCPVSHTTQTACVKIGFVNTGPAIRNLALIFVTEGGYSDWFAIHPRFLLSGVYTSPGCAVDKAHQMVCGQVASGAKITVYLMGSVETLGSFNYAVKFADISSGGPVYVNQRADGTHQIVSWTEVIT